jgi:hypothetical protein
MGLVAGDNGLQRHKSSLIEDMSRTGAAGIALHNPCVIKKCERQTPQDRRPAGAAKRDAVTLSGRGPQHALPLFYASSLLLHTFRLKPQPYAMVTVVSESDNVTRDTHLQS